MIEFGGWDMPVQYKTGIIKEHRAVRSRAGMFDVSHMGEATLRGDRAADAVQRLITNDVGKMRDGSALYTVMCNASGGIVDDCIVYRRAADDYMIVLNASNIAKDLAWIRDNTESRYGIAVSDESDATALIAVQGPDAVALVSGLSSADLAAIAPFHFAHADIAGVRCMAARTGYTGEDGFELACPAERAESLWNALLQAGAGKGTAAEPGLVPCGLGARDTLRLEARLSLYGNDIDDTTSPYEAGLGWVVKPDAGDFIGREALLAQKAEGPRRKLIGFTITGRGIARPGYSIVDRSRQGDDVVVGRVTSGTKGISVDAAIGLGYVPIEYAQIGNEITIDCRGKDVAATLVKGKFYQRQA
ncbi:MAG: glycine cleavage system aminomethyltransferase GcvT [Proteobacteria bacterium]|nr:glycine cleavage system aminomethyltransferase GcvT [Pseudomonadota bacterium]